MRIKGLSQAVLSSCILKIPILNVSKQTIESMAMAKFGNVHVCEWCMVNIKHYIDLFLSGDKIPNLLVAIVVKYKKA